MIILKGLVRENYLKSIDKSLSLNDRGRAKLALIGLIREKIKRSNKRLTFELFSSILDPDSLLSIDKSLGSDHKYFLDSKTKMGG